MHTKLAQLLGLLLLTAWLAAGCSTVPATLGTTGVVLERVGTDWLAVNAALVEGCKPSAPKLDQPTCVKARAVALKMKTAYPLAMNLYEAGVNANDANIAGGAKAVIRSLAVDGASLAIKVGLQFVKVD
jgi:hypothetical protein